MSIGARRTCVAFRLFLEGQNEEELSMRKILLCATIVLLSLPLASCKGNPHDTGVNSTGSQ